MHPSTRPNARITVPFHGTVLQNADKTLVSRPLDFNFATERFLISFALNNNRTVKVYWFISPDPTAPATGKPSGINPFESLGQVSYFVGDDEQVEIRHETVTFQRPQFIKMYLSNSDAFDHQIHGYVTLRANPPEVEI